MEDLVRKIQSMTLTRTDAEIAEYILAHLSTIGFQTSTTMAEEIGVSDTSVIRFIRKLGFKGYADFRSEMNARTARQIDRAQPDLTPGEKYLRTLEHLGSGSLISDVSQYTLNNLQKSYAQLDQGTVEQIVDILLRSDGSISQASGGQPAVPSIWPASSCSSPPMWCPSSTRTPRRWKTCWTSRSGTACSCTAFPGTPRSPGL